MASGVVDGLITRALSLLSNSDWKRLGVEAAVQEAANVAKAKKRIDRSTTVTVEEAVKREKVTLEKMETDIDNLIDQTGGKIGLEK